MGVKAGLAALCVAVVVGSSASAQDVTLVAREGGIVLTGTLQGYDGEFYRIDTAYGSLTVDGQVPFPLDRGDQLFIRRSRHTLRLVRLAGHSFFDTLRQKLQWSGSNVDAPGL